MNTLVSPLEPTFYYILAISEGGCTAIDSFQVDVAPSPQVEIIGDTTVCKGASTMLQAIDMGAGEPPYLYTWSTTSSAPSITVFGNGLVGLQKCMELPLQMRISAALKIRCRLRL